MTAIAVEHVVYGGEVEEPELFGALEELAQAAQVDERGLIEQGACD